MLAVVAAPIVEELLFRGVVLRGLRSVLAIAPAIALQAVLFGIAHVDPVRGRGDIGFVLVLAVRELCSGGGPQAPPDRTDVLAHGILNAVVMAIVLSGLERSPPPLWLGQKSGTHVYPETCLIRRTAGEWRRAAAVRRRGWRLSIRRT